MTLRANDIIPISEARARLTELAEDVVGTGSEKVLTKNGSSYVALVDAKRLDYYHALELEHAGLVLLAEAETALRQVLAGDHPNSAFISRKSGSSCVNRARVLSASCFTMQAFTPCKLAAK